MRAGIAEQVTHEGGYILAVERGTADGEYGLEVGV